MYKYINKKTSEVIEAYQYTLFDYIGTCWFFGYNPCVDIHTGEEVGNDKTRYNKDDHSITILDGNKKVYYNDYVIKDGNGVFYPCKPDVFKKNYEKIPVDEEEFKMFNFEIGPNFEIIKK